MMAMTNQSRKWKRLFSRSSKFLRNKIYRPKRTYESRVRRRRKDGQSAVCEGGLRTDYGHNYRSPLKQNAKVVITYAASKCFGVGVLRSLLTFSGDWPISPRFSRVQRELLNNFLSNFLCCSKTLCNCCANSRI